MKAPYMLTAESFRKSQRLARNILCKFHMKKYIVIFAFFFSLYYLTSKTMFVVFLKIAFLIVFSLFALYYYCPLIAYKRFKTYVGESIKQTIEITNDGLVFTCPTTMQFLSWDKIAFWGENKNHMIIFSRPEQYFALPIGEVESKENILETLKNNLVKHNVKKY